MDHRLNFVFHSNSRTLLPSVSQSDRRGKKREKENAAPTRKSGSQMNGGKLYQEVALVENIITSRQASGQVNASQTFAVASAFRTLLSLSRFPLLNPPTLVHGSLPSAHIPQHVACRVVISQTQKLLHRAIPDPSEPSVIKPLRTLAECDDPSGRLQPRPRCRPLGRAIMLPKVCRRPGLVSPPREAATFWLLST